ncbi:hypothetical protein [Streptomyces sp. NPDC048361]|uniref:hypothetical protein n=1 Tax=Streptomyces sp. NPDC048361 TaxID=3154720 RepID=UPI00342C45B8
MADRTGYGRTSWERYLGGRLLAPKAAVVALAEVTGTNPVHLTTMWELAERAWSRSEQRHERTVEAMRADRTRTAPGASGPPAAPGGARAGTPSTGLAHRPPRQGNARPAGPAEWPPRQGDVGPADRAPRQRLPSMPTGRHGERAPTGHPGGPHRAGRPPGRGAGAGSSCSWPGSSARSSSSHRRSF